MKKKQSVVKTKDDEGVFTAILTKEKPLSIDEERLKLIIRAEMERFLYDQVCDDMKKDEELQSGLDNFADDLADLQKEETITQAAERRRKARIKRREEQAKEIKWKQRQRHKCRKKRIQKEHLVFERWQKLISG